MKIVVQTGEHIGRSEIEYFISKIPSKWRKKFETVVVYGSREKDLKITFHEKEKVLGIHTPTTFEGTTNNIYEELVVGLAEIHRIGRIPQKISPSKRKECYKLWKEMSVQK